jgi:hypothetical protein
MGITNPNDFHMSAGSMNIGLFQYEGARWNRIDLKKNVEIPAGFGGYGELEKFEMFGPKNICATVSGGYMAQGNMEEQRVVVGVVENSLKVIYSAQKSSNDEGAGGTEDKETRISFKKSDPWTSSGDSVKHGQPVANFSWTFSIFITFQALPFSLFHMVKKKLASLQCSLMFNISIISTCINKLDRGSSTCLHYIHSYIS